MLAAAALVTLAACGGNSSSSSDTESSQRVKNAALETTTTVAIDDRWTIPCQFGGGCLIGDTGPAGGTVFYAGPSPVDAVAGVSDGGVYLEFQNYKNLTNNVSGEQFAWGCQDSTLLGADGIDVGTGAQNTLDIKNNCAESGTAAKVALDSNQSGKSDWFVPSIEELDLICQYTRGQTPVASSTTECPKKTKMTRPAGLNSYYYWASTETNPRRGKSYEMGDAYYNEAYKSDKISVVLVRAFGTLPTSSAPATRVYKCMYGGPCAVGETGPGGGTVFYTGTTKIDAYGDKYPGGKSLEFLDPFPTKKYKYRCAIHVNDTAQDVGAGAKNTALYRAACTDTGMPIELATNATNGGKSDWFIPSLDELNLLCRYLHGQSTTSNEQCNGKLKTNGTKNADVAQWSSFQYSKASMWGISFGDGTSIKRDKNDYSYNFFLVRATG